MRLPAANLARSSCLLLLVFPFLFAATAIAQDTSRARQGADTVLAMWKDYPGATPGRTPRWTYEQGVVLLGITHVWKKTGDQKYFNYIRQTLDHYVADDGTIRTYRAEEYNSTTSCWEEWCCCFIRERKPKISEGRRSVRSS